jgi:4a-hydroxytetrahydrobiopterin dehydratase
MVPRYEILSESKRKRILKNGPHGMFSTAMELRLGWKVAAAVLSSSQRTAHGREKITMAENSTPQPLPEAEIASRLRTDLPKWTLENEHLVRTYRTSGWKATLMVVNAIGHLAEAAWHHPDLSVHYSRVKVSLATHDAKGITTLDFALAAEIERLITWRPDPKQGGLPGTPDAPAATYILYD